MKRLKMMGLALAGFAAVISTEGTAVMVDEPIIIAHRGASGYLPEHTLAAYDLAIEQGADYIEPDLVMTKDGHLVVRHDPWLSDSTDVADHPEFADRKRVIQGMEDWWSIDFTLAELRTLKARQVRPARGTEADGQYDIPTFDEVIALAIKTRAGGRDIGIYPEVKHPALFTQAGLDPTAAVLEALGRVEAAGVPYFLQCFEPAWLSSVAGKVKGPRILLIDGKEDAPNTPALPLSLAAAEGFDGVGLYKELLVSAEGHPTDIVTRAHNAKLKVHVWTVRQDQVGPNFKTVEQEFKAIFASGVDGIFTDYPDIGVAVRGSFDLMKPPADID
ncbi:glycerophosphodiester phosphodiesterase family protein [Gimibacter soli]|uniref:glycerophosphodiester phosphodiesterase n=1 Tax=Gimibacter soli TaxID=3024400 RepID=A0AAE9XKS6_9PROT|nr:glycerophosphodiester phosphodiesterase family protein [Gimibacter soli]WCL52752.1 glycerophosphodiester phosphodiesterase family protein [Gimibacter soli]